MRQWETLKQTQEQLIQSAKMSAVGRLASGIAHELRNPLANILSSINLLELGRVSQQNMNAKYEIMKSEIHRARKIIDNLLNFVSPRESAQGTVDLLSIVNETISLLENQASLSKIKIDSQLARVPTIQGNATNLKQAFLNILINAIEAMPRGGILTVNMDVDGENIHIEIKDTGFGIPEDKKTQIFEPFYTTKAPGEGTGLGLALSYEIIHDHHGEIAVESEVEKGSIFIVTLPIGG